MQIEMPVSELVDQFEGRLISDLSQKVAEWSRFRQALTRWEKENLAEPSPSREKLAEHKEILGALIFYGQLFSLAASHPRFSDIELAEQIHANLWILREKFQMYHNPMDRAEAESILREVFPEP